jgi:hypothetical protein
VDVTENITATICEVWSEFNIFCILVTLIFFNPSKAATHYGGYSYQSESVGQNGHHFKIAANMQIKQIKINC